MESEHAADIGFLQHGNLELLETCGKWLSIFQWASDPSFRNSPNSSVWRVLLWSSIWVGGLLDLSWCHVPRHSTGDGNFQTVATTTAASPVVISCGKKGKPCTTYHFCTCNFWNTVVLGNLVCFFNRSIGQTLGVLHHDTMFLWLLCR